MLVCSYMNLCISYYKYQYMHTKLDITHIDTHFICTQVRIICKYTYTYQCTSYVHVFAGKYPCLSDQKPKYQYSSYSSLKVAYIRRNTTG